MRTICRILLAAMVLVTAWTALGLTGSHARAEPPGPCRFFAKCE